MLGALLLRAAFRVPELFREQDRAFDRVKEGGDLLVGQFFGSVRSTV